MNWLYSHAYDIGANFAYAIWPFFGRRRRLAIDNVLKCQITDDPNEAKRIAKASWGHLAGHIMEALFVPKVITAENWREHLDVTTDADPEAVKLLLDTPDTPILLASGHHGVWEAATNMISFVRPMIAIARVMNNKLVQNWLKNHHFRGRITVIDKNHGFSPEIMHQWADERAAMTILMDQHTSGGKMLSFLGRPAKTFTSVTRLAMRTGYPIVVGTFVRVAPFQYRLVGDKPLKFDKDTNLEEATQLLNDRIGAAIRKYPEQYLWAHRRWR